VRTHAKDMKVGALMTLTGLLGMIWSYTYSKLYTWLVRCCMEHKHNVSFTYLLEC